MILKEMKYKAERLRKPEVLARDSYKGYEYFCISLGTHPCAYVVISEGQPYYDFHWWTQVDLEIHGGCTYLEWGYRGIIEDSFKVLGWDYGHYNDFSGFDSKDFLNLKESMTATYCKKWTTAEMEAECKNVIEQLYVLEHPELLYK